MLKRSVLPAIALAALLFSPAAAPSGAGAVSRFDPGGGSSGGQQGTRSSLDSGGTCFSTHSFSAGLTAFSTCFTQDGNVGSFAVGGTGGPFEHLRNGAFIEGYVLCSSSGVSGYDLESGGEAGFNDPTVVQPNGPNTFPLTITRTTTDLRFSLKQTFTATAARVVTVTMSVTNTHGALLTGVKLARVVDMDIDNSTGGDTFYLTHRAVTAFTNPGGGYLTLTGTTRSRAVTASVGAFDLGTEFQDCSTLSGTSVFGPTDGEAKAVYDIGSIGKDASRDVVFTLAGD